MCGGGGGKVHVCVSVYECLNVSNYLSRAKKPFLFVQFYAVNDHIINLKRAKWRGFFLLPIHIMILLTHIYIYLNIFMGVNFPRW